MHAMLKDYINKEIIKAATFVNKYMPINMKTDDIYEALVGEPHVLEAFRNAMRYLPPVPAHDRYVSIKFGHETLNTLLRLSPTEKYNQFLLPNYELAVTPEGELGQALAAVLKVARDWDTLKTLWEKFRDHVMDAHALGFIFPWLRDVMIDFDIHKLEYAPKLKTEREEIMRDAARLRNRAVPTHFPRMSPDLKQACQSGVRLFAQYRMLESATNERVLRQAPLIIDRARNRLIHEWVIEHMNETITEWREEQAQRLADRKARLFELKWKRRRGYK